MKFLAPQRAFILLPFLVYLISLHCGKQTARFNAKELVDYPSGSAIEFLNGKIYLLGDDAPDLIILNEYFEKLDSINLVQPLQKRIPKNSKPDFESMTLVDDIQPHLLLLGSGSFDTLRNKGVLVNTTTKEKTEFRLDVLYQRIKDSGIRELNIEALCRISDRYIIGNRGNSGFPENHLVFLSNNFWTEQETAIVKTVQLQTDTAAGIFKGISGLVYSAKKDWLIISISSEDTPNAYEDGLIGNSFLWIIKDLSTKLDFTVLKPDVIIDLNELDGSFAGHKIESVCIASESNKLELFLVADDDKGASWICKIQLNRL